MLSVPALLLKFLLVLLLPLSHIRVCLSANAFLSLHVCHLLSCSICRHVPAPEPCVLCLAVHFLAYCPAAYVSTCLPLTPTWQ
jgi:hypothetical protein